MKADFRTPLDIERVAANTRRLLNPLVYYSAILDRELTVPAGFEYDGASVPWWLPAAYAAIREVAEKAGAVHDYLYSNHSICSRAQADDVLREAMEADGVGIIRRNLTWAAVRLFGGFPYDDDDEHQPQGDVK